jgi:phosphoglycolate phosphatase
MVQPLKLVMFDFDGTLVDSQAAIVTAMREAFAGAGLPPPPAGAVKRVVGLRLEAAVGALAPQADSAAVADMAEGYRQAFFRLRSRPDHEEPVFPGARAVLRALEEAQVLLGIATGKNRRGLLASLERHELSGHFTVLKTADDGPGKPHPAILERAMSELGVEPRDTVMVGDTVFDMEMARNARARAVGVSWGYHEPGELAEAGAHRVIDSFEDLLPTLSELDIAAL